MKLQQKQFRILILRCIALAVFGALLTRLAWLQLVHGDELAAQVSHSTTRTYTEIAARGSILDRNGDPLVSHALGFVLQLDHYQWDKSTQNQVLLQLTQLLHEQGEEYADGLPMTTLAPFTYTYSSRESGDGLKLSRFLEKQKDWPQDPDSATLFDLLCQRYDIPADWGLYDKRAVVGLRYYLELQEFSNYNNLITVAENVSIDTVTRISESGDTLAGVTVQVDDLRRYDTPYAAHILGRVAVISREEYLELKDDGYGMTDSLGKDGMEKVLESYLRGIDGKRAVEVSSVTGQVTGEYMVIDPDPGDNCYLTLDLDLQRVAEEALADTMQSIRDKGALSASGSGADAEGGAVVVLDVNSGEVLAMASYPTYNLATFSEDFAEGSQNPLSPYLNRAIGSVYSPGSTFKMVTSVAALEEGIVTPETRIRDEGIYRFYKDYQPRCWIYRDKGTTHGNITVSEALKYSCNYFFYEVSRIMGIDTLNKYAVSFGLGQRTGIELTGEKAGNLAGPESREKSGGPMWQPGETLQAAIGQTEQQFTPLQLANYVATLVNGGTRYQPHLLKQVVDYTGETVVLEQQPVVLDRVNISQTTVDAVKEGMRGVVTEDGTASSVFRNFPISVGGKTGSAQTRSGRSAHGVFVSFAPYDDPEIVVCVIGEYAGSGGSVAPVCVAIYEEYFGVTQTEPAPVQPVQPVQPAAPAPQQPEEPDANLPPEEPVQPAEPAPQPDAEPDAEPQPAE